MLTSMLVGLTGIDSLARAATVVLVRSPKPTAVAAEATVRLRGELVAAGFDVRVIDPPLGADVRASLEEAATAPDVEAVVAILGGDSGGGGGGGDLPEESAELWVIDRVTGKTVVRRVSKQAQAHHGAEVLSIRALELLRASFLEVALAAGRAPKVVQQAPPTEVTRWTDAAIADAAVRRLRPTWAIEAGACVLGSLEGLAPSVMPVARIQRAFGELWLGRLTVAGLGTTPALDGKDGKPKVKQEFGLFEAALRFRRDNVFLPFLSLGVGATHVSATGQGNHFPLTEAASSARWSFTADLGAGLHISPWGRVELAWEAHAQVAQPYPSITYDSREVVAAGRPTLVSTLTLLAWM